jgi:ATP-binding cassette subfamily F protein 3
LNEFEGTVMLVSHDRALLRAVCDEFWLVGRGEIKPFDGDLDDYQRYLLDESKRLREEAKLSNDANISTSPQDTKVIVAEVPVAKSSEQRKLDSAKRQEINALTKPIKKSIEKAEKQMAVLNVEKEQLEGRLMLPIPPAEMAEAGKNLKQVNDQLAKIEEQWLGWAADIEEIENSA